MGFNGAEDDTLLGVFHESTEQNKEKKFTLKVFKSFPPINVEDAKVNPSHLIFDLKGAFVGKEYF
jgi:hypothetical protein